MRNTNDTRHDTGEPSCSEQYCYRCLRRSAELVALERRREIPVCESCLRDGDRLWLDGADAVATVEPGCCL